MKYSIMAALTLILAACANNNPYATNYPAVFPYAAQQQPIVQPITPIVVPQQAPMQTITTTSPMVGASKDDYGCQSGTGTTWSVLHQQCVQLFNIANIRMTDPDNSNLAVYAILSKDKKQAEIFSASLPTGIILSATKGGFISKNGKIRLVDLGKNNWKIVK